MLSIFMGSRYIHIYISKEEKSQINRLFFYFVNPEEAEQNKPRSSIREEIKIKNQRD
jgi:hypothetical protein